MEVCSSFTSTVECAIQLNNDYNVKLLILFSFLVYAVFAYYMSYKIDSDKSMFHFLLTYYFRVGSGLYIISFILMLLTLRHSVPMESFVFIVIGVYGVSTAIAIGASILFAKNYIFELVGAENMSRLKENYKYSKR